MQNQLQQIVEKLRPFSSLELKGGFDFSKAKLLATAMGVKADTNLLQSLLQVVTDVAKDLQGSPEKVTVGRVLAHPKLEEFIKTLPPAAEWKLVRCPRCGRAAEKNLVSPTPCHVCGFNWQATGNKQA